jgi:hypothetical protein
MAPAERSFDADFYAQFARLAATRLRQVSDGFTAAAAPTASPNVLAAAINEARHALHNITGEARLLEMPDYAALVRRTSMPLGRIGTPMPALDVDGLRRLAALCAELATLAEGAPDVGPESPVWQKVKGTLDALKA